MLSKEKQDRIRELVNNIENRKTQDSSAATYRDSKDLRELASIAMECNGESESLSIAFEAYGFLSEKYESMGRFSVAGDFRTRELMAAKEMKDNSKPSEEELADILKLTLRDRNYYVDDDCDDVKELAGGLISENVVQTAFEGCFARRRNLKHDPIEMTPKYLEVIDEVEEKIDKNLKYRGLGSCHEIWNLKFEYLMEKGIVWKSPAMLNPRVRFD